MSEAQIAAPAPVDLNNLATIEVVLDNPEIRKMEPGSEAFQTAVNEKLAEAPEVPVTDKEAVVAADATPDADEVEVQEKSKKGFTKRIKHVLGERDTARADNARLAAELAALKATPPAQAVETHVQSPDYSQGFDKAKPQSHEFNTLGEFTEALTDWKADQREFARSQEKQAERVQTEQRKVASAWDIREAAVKEANEDYEAVVSLDTLGGANITKPSHTASREFLAASQHGPEVLYQLLQNDELTQKFKAAAPVQQVAMLAKLEATVEAATQKAPKAVGSRLPPEPPTKHKPGAGKVEATPLTTLADSGDFGAYARQRDAEEKARRVKK